MGIDPGLLEVTQGDFAARDSRSSLRLDEFVSRCGPVVAEAMASGIPAIVTHRTGASDLIVDGHNGYIVPPGDHDAIRDRLFHLAHRPGLLREMGRAARETARSMTFEKFRQRYVSCLEALAA